jgi:hypothetical protein
MTTTLRDFEQKEPLKVKESTPVNVNGSVLAWAGPSNRDKNVVVSHRHRFEYDDGKQDYFRKYGGYCYGDSTLNVMEEIGATRIAVLEVDNGRVIEYNAQQFRESDLVAKTFDIGGKNICVPVDDALYTWDSEDCTIIQDH